jgi:hypothetical protein
VRRRQRLRNGAWLASIGLLGGVAAALSRIPALPGHAALAVALLVLATTALVVGSALRLRHAVIAILLGAAIGWQSHAPVEAAYFRLARAEAVRLAEAGRCDPARMLCVAAIGESGFAGSTTFTHLILSRDMEGAPLLASLRAAPDVFGLGGPDSACATELRPVGHGLFTLMTAC